MGWPCGRAVLCLGAGAGTAAVHDSTGGGGLYWSHVEDRRLTH